MKKKSISMALVIVLLISSILYFVPVSNVQASSNYSLSGVAHIQNIGDRRATFDGTTLSMGTTGQSKRLESVMINFQNNTGYSGSLRYRVHIQNLGWTNWVQAGQRAGTSGRSLRLEGIQIELTGDIANYYSVKYRVHIQNYGWQQGWQYDGALAGTEAESKRLESLEVKLVPKTEKMGVAYRVHRQDYGWEMPYKINGSCSGTTGQSKRLEGIEIALTGNEYSGGIEYRTHVQNYGWQSFVSNGMMSGTSGKSLRLESIDIKLNGEVAKHYDVYYRVHAQDYGWLGWAKNGESAGTSGQSKRLEAIQIVLIDKNNNGPGLSYGGIASVSPTAYLQKGGSLAPKTEVKPTPSEHVHKWVYDYGESHDGYACNTCNKEEPLDNPGSCHGGWHGPHQWMDRPWSKICSECGLLVHMHEWAWEKDVWIVDAQGNSIKESEGYWICSRCFNTSDDGVNALPLDRSTKYPVDKHNGYMTGYDFEADGKDWNFEILSSQPADHSVHLTGINLYDVKRSMKPGTSYRPTVQFVPSCETVEPHTVKWESSDSSVVSVDSTGLITAISHGTATIKATASNGAYQTIFIRVENNPIGVVDSFELVVDGKTDDIIELEKGRNYEIKVVTNPTNAVYSVSYSVIDEQPVSKGNRVASITGQIEKGDLSIWSWENNPHYTDSSSRIGTYSEGTATLKVLLRDASDGKGRVVTKTIVVK